MTPGGSIVSKTTVTDVKPGLQKNWEGFARTGEIEMAASVEAVSIAREKFRTTCVESWMLNAPFVGIDDVIVGGSTMTSVAVSPPGKIVAPDGLSIRRLTVSPSSAAPWMPSLL